MNDKQKDIDLEQAKTMLQALNPKDGNFTFQTFADGKQKTGLTTLLQGDFKQHASKLKALNQQGAGIFITVNQTDGKGRKSENITGITALFVDFDTINNDRLTMLTSLDKKGLLLPSMVIESSKGKHHAYWLVENIPLDNFADWQKRLIGLFDSLGDSPDKAIHDLARVMRLAGFYHNKNEPILTRIIYPQAGKAIQRYSYEQIKVMFNSLPALKLASQNAEYEQLSPSILANNPKNKITLNELNHYLSFIDNNDYDKWLNVGMALHYETKGGLEGLDLWNSWSKGCNSYQGYDDLDYRYKGFNSDNKDKPVTIATLIYYAKDNPNYSPSNESWTPKHLLTPLNSDLIIDLPLYPIQAFTDILRGAIEAIAYYAQVPLEMAGQCVLGAIASIGQCFVNAPFGNSHIPASLFLLTEAESGSGKTKTNEYAYKAIYDFDKQQNQTYRESLNSWKLQSQCFTRKNKADFLANNPAPINQSMLMRDATIESVLNKFIKDGLKNLSWATDEAGEFFNGYSMKSDTVGQALASLTKIYSKGESHRHRVKDEHMVTSAYDVRLTLDIMGQKAILEPALGNRLFVNQGFLPRFLLACPENLQGKRVWNSKKRMEENPELDKRLISFWSRCEALLKELNSCESERKNLDFQNNAMKMLADYQQQIECRQGTNKDLEYIRPIASRMAENATRIATLMAFFDRRETVTEKDLQNAFLLVEFSTQTWLCYSENAPLEKNDSQKLLDWLIEKAKNKPSYELSQSWIKSNTLNFLRKNPKYLCDLLQRLRNDDYLRFSKKGKQAIIMLNPNLF